MSATKKPKEGNSLEDAHGEITALEDDAWRRTLAALQQSEARYCTIVENLVDYVSVLNLDGVFTFVNDAYCRLINKSRQEIIGKRAVDVLEPNHYQILRDTHAKLTPQNPILQQELRLTRPLGQEIFVAWTDRLILDDRGNPLEYHGIGRDITEKERAERALQDTQERYRLVVELANEGITFIDENGLTTFTNRKFAEMLGYNPAELIGQPVSIYTCPEDWPTFESRQRERRKGQSDLYERRFLRKDGSVFWGLVSATPLFREGRFTGSFATITDITGRKLIEDALRESQENYRNLFQNAAVGLFRTSFQSGKILECNDQYARMLGYESHQDLIGAVDFTSFYQDPYQRDRLLSLLSEHGSVSDFETELITKQGKPFWVRLSAKLNPQKGWIEGVIEDISGRKRAELDLEARTHQQEVVALLGQRALSGEDLDVLFKEAAVLLAQVLGVEYSKILELLPDRESLLLRAGFGWREGLVGQARVSADKGSQAGYTLLSNTPVVVEDLRTETRFQGPALLHDHNVVSGMSVVIAGQTKPYGVLGVHTCQRRSFSRADVDFLQAVANVLASAIDRKNFEVALRESESMFRGVVEQASEGLALVDEQGLVVIWNHAMEEITGFKGEEVLNRPIWDVQFQLAAPERKTAEYYAQLRTSLSDFIQSGTAPWAGRMLERDYTRPDGTHLFVAGVISSIKTDKGYALLSIARDITQQKMAEEQLSHLATHDALTNLPNRTLLYDRLDHAIAQAQRSQGRLAVFFIDLNRFKHINDLYGHHVGDSVLQQVADRLQGCARQSDTVARLGGDEFALILENLTHAEDATTVVGKIFASMAQPFRVDGDEVVLSVSIGISLYPEDGKDGETLLKRADAAMYRAKALGINSFQFVDSVRQQM